MEAVSKAAEILKDRLTVVREEGARIEKALEHLNGSPIHGSTKPASTGRRRRARGGGRAAQVIEVIKENPEATVPVIAKSLKMKPNYLYRLLGDLQKENKIKKRGRTYSI